MNKCTMMNNQNSTCYGLHFLMVLSMIITCAGYAIYFPLSSVKITIPKTDKVIKVLTKIPLGKFQIVSLNSDFILSDIVYKLENTENYLQINEKNGEIKIGNNFYNMNKTTLFIITGQVRKRGSFNVAHMSLEIEPFDGNDYCLTQLEKLCFWESAYYTIAEDSDIKKFLSSQIGEFGSKALQNLCPQYIFNYQLESPNEYLEIKNQTLYTKTKLDYDSFNPGPILNVDVKCSVHTGPNRFLKQIAKRLKITILDRNDNWPQFQEKKKFTFWLDDPHFHQNDTVGDKILLLDHDSVVTNSRLVYEIHDDIYDILKPSCNIFETDHRGLKNSAISCQLKFSHPGILRKSPYCVKLKVRDMSLESEYINPKSISSDVCIKTNLSKIHDIDSPKALAIKQQRRNKSNRNARQFNSMDDSMASNEFDGLGLSKNSAPIAVVYPKDVYVYRTAKNLTRVAQPLNMEKLIKYPKYKFSIISDPTHVFSITQLAGILYVGNMTALKTAHETIYYVTVSWMKEVKDIVIHFENGHPINTSCEHEVDSRTQSCSHVKSKKLCSKFCGLATNGGSCEWRGIETSIFSINYATCTPNSTQCPDTICDPLEKLDMYHCPQDCAPENKTFGPRTINSNNLGILSASGVCSCDETTKCTCISVSSPSEKTEKKGSRKSLNNKMVINQTMLTYSSGPFFSGPKVFECGPSCLVLAIVCPTLLIIIVICLIISRKKYIRKAKRKNLIHKGDGDNQNDLPLVSIDYDMKFDCNTDSKWEFSRDLLVLDITLGEGEFGKVLRGYATNIADRPGTTTVAVKMLKTGANSVELLALLSEFQLLQEVSHPNVIKLLGACTKVTSPLLIIEYAKHGSLRNYLRLSRKIESSGVDFTDGVEQVTVKEILSFAWQICKGMTYLTEIKLVHRDLAARNVLLAEGKICKISDFGLTRDVYEDDAYLKRSRDRVPVKWMAPESLADHVYTTKSDVWAFSVLCWELITLGASPYPGIPPQNLYHLLKSGYRMERPENCSEDIYTILRSCWADDPNLRPSFKYLASQWEKLLGNNAKYIQLECAVSNPMYCDDTKSTNNLDEPESLQHLWQSPVPSYNTKECCDNVNEDSISSPNETNLAKIPHCGYDFPRPLMDTKTTEQILRYENDLRFPLNIRKGHSNINQEVSANHYSVPVKRGRSYIDMTNKTLIPDNLNSEDIEKKLSKNISFRFSSLLNLNEQENTVF